jgi:hypothetical protein
MPNDTIQLTKDKDAICKIIDRHIDREEARMSYRYTTWSLAWYYLNGARRFDVFDPDNGLVQPHFLDEEGNMEFQSQELLAALDRVSSQIASMDVRPKINRTGSSLQSIRDRAIAQVIADGVIPTDRSDEVLTEFAHIFTALGSCGITGHIVDHPVVGLTTDFEVVHPRELYPFPSLGQDHTKQRGLIRERIVPLDFLTKKYGRKIKTNLDKMFYYEVEAGAAMTGVDEYDRLDHTGAGPTYNNGHGSQALSEEKTRAGLAKIRELWIYGHRNMVERYVLMSGEYVIEDIDFEGAEVYCPIGFARFMETGSFHGAGLFDLLFSISREMEKLLKSLFNNIRDIDQYGVLVMPQGQFNERAALRDVGRGLRVLPYEPDAIDPGFRPFNIAPFNSGDLPGKTAAFAKQLMESISPYRDLMENKGRVDSAAGLGFLDEKNRQLMAGPMRAVERAFSQSHRASLASAARVLARTRQALPVSQLTLDLAGAIVDPAGGSVSFAANPLPNLSSLSVTIKGTQPRSEVARKQEALQLYQMQGLNDPTRFILFALQEGLDFAMYMEEEKAAYESVVRSILLLFGDGENPGEIVLTPHTVLPELQMRVLSSFMTSPVMSLASTEVQDEFKKFREFLFRTMGTMLPAGVPLPEEAAMMVQQAQQGQQQQPQGVPQQ